eukprot:6791899-Prymnesium_polylepis.1
MVRDAWARSLARSAGDWLWARVRRTVARGAAGREAHAHVPARPDRCGTIPRQRTGAHAGVRPTLARRANRVA